MTGMPLPRLGISGVRRVLGIIMVLAMYGIGIMTCIRVPQHVATENWLESLSTTEIRGLSALVGAIYGTPYILIPCLLDRFPSWITQVCSAKQLRWMARWFFGANYTA
jgi:hypothetical protein